MSADLGQDVFRFVKNPMILKSDNTDAVALRVHSLITIANSRSISCMRFTIELNSETLGGTIKVKDIIAETVLPSKLAAVDLRALQHSPQSGLGRCERPPEFCTKTSQVW